MVCALMTLRFSQGGPSGELQNTLSNFLEDAEELNQNHLNQQQFYQAKLDENRALQHEQIDEEERKQKVDTAKRDDCTAPVLLPPSRGFSRRRGLGDIQPATVKKAQLHFVFF